MSKPPQFPTVVITCEHCGLVSQTPIFGVESAIYQVCEVCRKITAHIVVKESEQ
jgi:hypothetical protein